MKTVFIKSIGNLIIIMLLMSPALYAAKDKSAEYVKITWKLLKSFKAEYPDPQEIQAGKTLNAVPDHIQALHQTPVEIEGFMMPSEMDGDKVISFVLMYDRGSCCFGATPSINAWIYVKMKKGVKVKFTPDIPVLVTGILEVGDHLDDDGGVSFYRMQGETVKVSKNSKCYLFCE